MSLQKILRYAVLGGIFLIPFICLLVLNQTFFPFITGKNFAFRILVELLAGGYLILAVSNPVYRPKRSWLLYALSAFVIIIAIADLQGVFPFKSIWSNYERMEGLVTIIHLLVYFIIAAMMLHSEKLWNWFFSTTIGVSLIMVIYGLLQLAGKIPTHQGAGRLDASLGNSAYLAVYMIFHVFLTAYILVTPGMSLFGFKTRQNKIFTTKSILAIIIIILQTTVLYYTETRGALLGIVGGVFVSAFLIALFDRSRPLFRKIALGIAVLVLIVIGAFFVFKNSSFVKKSSVLSRFASISLSDSTTQSRFLIWNMAIKGVKERPILGWGQENFNYVFNKFYDPKMYAQEQWFDRTHNIIFDWLVAGGILGLASYLFFYGTIIWQIWKKPKQEHISHFSLAQKSILTGLLTAYFIHNFFVFDNIVSYILFFTVAAYVYHKKTTSGVADEHVPDSHIKNRIIVPVAAVITLLVVYAVNARPIFANTTLIGALSEPVTTDATPALTDYVKALSYDSYGTPEVREQLDTQAAQLISTQSAVPSSQELVGLAINELTKQVQEKPGDARYDVLLGLLLSSANQPSALQYLNQALVYSPGKQSILFAIGNSYLMKNDFPNALATFKKAYEEDTDDTDALLAYAATAIYGKDYTLAAQLLKPLPSDVVANNDDILNAYNANAKYDEVIAIWKYRIAQNPTNIQDIIHLGAAYLEANDLKDALTELQKAQSLDDPSHSSSYQQYIDQIKAGKNPLTASK